jgi:cell division protein FtsW
VLALIMLGTVMVYSASIALADSPRYNVAPTHFLRATCSRSASHSARRRSRSRCRWPPGSAGAVDLRGAMVLLVLVLIPGVGKGVNGARRWMPLGILNLQPSELMKVACVLYAANFTVRKQDYMHHFRKGFLPMGR